MSRSPLLRLESLLRRIVEEPFSWVSTGGLDPYGLAGHLLRVVAEQQEDGKLVTTITVHVHPTQLAGDETAHKALEQTVLSYVDLLAERTGQPLAFRPVIQIVADNSVGPRGARIETSDEALSMQPNSTAVFAKSARDDIAQAIVEADAFLIVQGRQHISLQRPVIRIGRRVDNDIVLDSAAVSRHHAQLQWRDNGYVLFDTSTHQRTWINGEPVREHRLQSGDVVALSDVLLVYGEGREPAADKPGDEGYVISDTLLGP